MADHMMLSDWFIYILLHQLAAGSFNTRCNNAAFTNFVAAISRTNSNWFEFVQLIAATKFCRSENDFHKINCVTQGELLRRLVPATCHIDSSLSVHVSRPLGKTVYKYCTCTVHDVTPTGNDGSSNKSSFY